MRVLFIAVCAFLFIVPAFAQKETRQWFLNNNRISVSPNGVNNLNSNATPPFNPYAGSTSVSDADGNLLFASDGATVIDKNGNIMPALRNTQFATNQDKVLAVKVPGNNMQYFIFYTAANAYTRNATWTLKYAMVDLSLNNGLGDVVTFNQVIATDVSQGYTLVKGIEDVWLVTHKAMTDSFLAYQLTDAGLNLTPVASKAGTLLHATGYFFKDLNTSHNGKLVAGISYKDETNLFAEAFQHLEVFYFDAATGKLTPKVRTKRGFVYFFTYQSVSFSADDRLVYGGYMQRIYGLQPCGWGGGSVVQYNLCYSDSADFTKYAMQVATDNNWCGSNISWGRIQMGADKKIYMQKSGLDMARISYPNRIGSSSGFTAKAYQLSVGNNSNVAMPAFYHAQMEKAVKNNIVYDGGCFPEPLRFKITNDTITNINWNFGDPGSSNNITTGAAPQHYFSKPGFYTVTAQLYNSNHKLIEEVSELVEVRDPAKRLLYDYPTDTIFCEGGSVKLKLNVTNGIFHWSTKVESVTYSLQTADSITINSSGKYYVEMRQNDCNGCVQKDSINVIVLPSPYVNLGADKNLCLGDSMKLQFYDATADYLWSTGETTPDIWIKKGGTYWVEAEFNKNGCPQRDTVVIKEMPAFNVSLPNDTVLCNNQTLLLDPKATNAYLFWQDYSTQPTYLVTQPGTYWIQAFNNNGCTKTDTVKVTYVNADAIFLGNDTTLCTGEEIVLRSNITGANYLWSTGAKTNAINVRQAGTYWLQVDNGACTVTDTINIRFNTPPVINLGQDTTLCQGEQLHLSATVPNAAYSWQDGSVSNSNTVTQPGIYWLQVKQDGCTVSDTIKVAYKPLPVVNLGGDRTICSNESTTLEAGNISGSTYTWQDGSAKGFLNVFKEGIYWVKVQAPNGCSASDTVRIITTPIPEFTLGRDTVLCEGQGLNFHFAIRGASYLWGHGSNAPDYTITQPGVYTLEVNNGCIKKDTLEVRYKPLPRVNLGNDTLVCEGFTKLLDATTTGATYEWQDKSTNSTFLVAKPGLYHAAVTLDGCTKRDSVRILYQYKPQFSLGRDTALCAGRQFVLQPAISNVSYLWHDGSTAASFTVQQPGTYALTAANACGSTTDAIQVSNGVCKLYMPTAFTPNNDGLNDIFRVKDPGFIKTFKMTVFNRWGEVIFTTTDPYKGWNGKYKNVLQPIGTYIWQISLTSNDGTVESGNGSVSLLY